jgi:hypothetical protein
MSRKTITAIALMAACSWPSGRDAFARVNVNINIGEPAPVYVAPMPPPPPPRRIIVERRPEFMYTPSLGFSVSIGGPRDMVYYGDRYYVYDDGGWYWAPSYSGPWVFVESHRLPPRIGRYRYEEIRRYRDEEYRRRHDNGNGYGNGHDRGRGHGHDRNWR